jgi:tRNA1(Val) A37 N6-methylase TrmN6
MKGDRMLKKIQGKKLSKKTNYKQNFKKFVESDYTNLDAFKKACKGDENLLIYTCLKPDELNVFIEGMKQYEEHVRMSRMVYNDTATKMNRMVRQWPSSIVASMLHFDQKDYLKVDEEQKKSYPNLDEAFKK